MQRVITAFFCLAISSGALAQDAKRDLSDAFAAIEPRVIEWRRDFHEHPELSNREFRTAAKVAEHLEKLDFDSVETGPDGLVTEELADEWRRFFEQARRPPIDHRRQLLSYGMTVNHLRTYRREALDDIGGFAEQPANPLPAFPLRC